jgi:hypothetical protein
MFVCIRAEMLKVFGRGNDAVPGVSGYRIRQELYSSGCSMLHTFQDTDLTTDDTLYRTFAISRNLRVRR